MWRFLSMLNKKMVMNLDTFLATTRVKNGNENQLEVFAIGIRKNRIVEKAFVIVLAISMSISKVATSPINIQTTLGTLSFDPVNFLPLLISFSYWVLLISGSIELLRIIMKEKEDRNKKMLMVITKYAVIYASLLCIPAAFGLLVDLF